GVQAAQKVHWVMFGLTVRTLPSPMPTCMPPTNGDCGTDASQVIAPRGATWKWYGQVVFAALARPTLTKTALGVLPVALMLVNPFGGLWAGATWKVDCRPARVAGVSTAKAGMCRSYRPKPHRL